MITIEQLRAARGLLGWSQSELAERAGLSLPTVKRLEAGLARECQTKHARSCSAQSRQLELNLLMKTGEG